MSQSSDSESDSGSLSSSSSASSSDDLMNNFMGHTVVPGEKTLIRAPPGFIIHLSAATLLDDTSKSGTRTVLYCKGVGDFAVGVFRAKQVEHQPLDYTLHGVDEDEPLFLECWVEGPGTVHITGYMNWSDLFAEEDEEDDIDDLYPEDYLDSDDEDEEVEEDEEDEESDESSGSEDEYQAFGGRGVGKKEYVEPGPRAREVDEMGRPLEESDSDDDTFLPMEDEEDMSDEEEEEIELDDSILEDAEPPVVGKRKKKTKAEEPEHVSKKSKKSETPKPKKPETPVGKYPCPSCPKTCNTPVALEQHQKAKHGAEAATPAKAPKSEKKKPKSEKKKKSKL